MSLLHYLLVYSGPLSLGIPLHIEAYLREVGFSAMEVLVLRKLIDDALSLRELAAKTGKSTGSLDQGVKRLLRKKIIRREKINESPKFVLGSFESVARWVGKDMQKQREMLHRKHQDFESFMQSLKVHKNRPELEYFEGVDGIKQAYLRLLELGSELCRYLPVRFKEEEDPLHEFHTRFLRTRLQKEVFEYVIAEDNALGRRYRSRDPFEYRKTLLIPPGQYPFILEEIVVGGTIAYFDQAQVKACFVHYPELADSQRKAFRILCSSQGHADIPR